jgi:hypothetical protein
MAEAGTPRKKIPAWRYKVGLGMFVVGNLMVPLSPAFTAVGLPASYIPVVIVAGEVMIFGAIPFLGKQGFLELKNKVKALFKRKPVEELEPVSHWRHILGLILVFVTPFLLLATATFFGYSSYSGATLAQPFPEIWGIAFEEQRAFFLTLMIGSELSGLVGLVLLGGLWWEQFRKLFVWPGEKLQTQ